MKPNLKNNASIYGFSVIMAALFGGLLCIFINSLFDYFDGSLNNQTSFDIALFGFCGFVYALILLMRFESSPIWIFILFGMFITLLFLVVTMALMHEILEDLYPLKIIISRFFVAIVAWKFSDKISNNVSSRNV